MSFKRTSAYPSCDGVRLHRKTKASRLLTKHWIDMMVFGKEATVVGRVKSCSPKDASQTAGEDILWSLRDLET